jgi:hypothetical protein
VPCDPIAMQHKLRYTHVVHIVLNTRGTLAMEAQRAFELGANRKFTVVHEVGKDFGTLLKIPLVVVQPKSLNSTYHLAMVSTKAVGTNLG